MPDDDDDFYDYYSDSDDDPTNNEPTEDVPTPEPITPPPPRPVNLTVNPIEHNRCYSLVIQLLSEQGNGFGIQATIKITEKGKRGGRVCLLQTDNNGFLLYRTKSFFKEDEHDFFIQVIGVAGLEVEFTLDRPE